VALSSASLINSSSTGTGEAGNINLTARDTVQLTSASITTEASVDSDGGDISINAPNLVYLFDSKITSSVGGGPETRGGNIAIDPQFVVLNNSQIIAQAYQGSGGNISIVADNVLQDPQSLISASSQLGINGSVDIQAAINDVSGVVAPLSSDFVSSSTLLRERCMARIREGKYSSFIVGGRDGIPIEPGNMLPGVMMQ
jgi:large exoprotein involved in heme utilization and adhesion